MLAPENIKDALTVAEVFDAKYDTILDYVSTYDFEEGHSHPVKEGARADLQLYFLRMTEDMRKLLFVQSVYTCVLLWSTC
jgi:hypothetical protein